MCTDRNHHSAPSALYDERVRRLLQLGFVLLVMATFFTPLAEFFDRWDAPGLNNDTEFAIFALVFLLCLVLLVCKLISSLAAMGYRIYFPYSPPRERITSGLLRIFSDAVISGASPPLRI
ncbi:MAG: hypothetical protein ABI380_00545 [Edaphobacter sp.]